MKMKKKRKSLKKNKNSSIEITHKFGHNDDMLK